MANADVNFISGRMNKDFDERLIPSGEYIDALNIRIGSTENNSIGAVENAKGNVKLTNIQYNGAPLINAKCIGAYEDGSRETIYWFIVSDDVDMVVSFDANKNILKYHVVSESVLNFDSKYLITGINLIDNLLFWTDNLNPPRKINIERNYPTPILGVDQIDESDISVIVAPPTEAPGITLTLVPDEENYITDKFISFSYRYKYKDDEYSALSQFSEIAFEPGNFFINYSTFENSGMENIFNSVNVSFNTGDSNVIGIDICFKLSDSNIINVIEKYDKKNQGWLDNTIKEIEFTNKKVYTTLTESELLRLFDNVPRLAKAQTTMGNRLMYGNYVDGYNISDDNGNPIVLDYDLSVISEDIGFKEIPVTFANGSSYTIDSSSTTVIEGSKFNIDLTGMNLSVGSYFSINFNLIHDSFGGDPSYNDEPLSPAPQNNFLYTFIFNIQKDYTNVYELANSQEFIDAISTHNAYVSCESGTSVTDKFNCGIVPKNTWSENGSGILNNNGSFVISSSLGSNIIGIQIPAVEFRYESSPGIFIYAYEYFTNSITDVVFSKLGAKQSLHSNRDYEVGIVYMDEYSRSSTVLVDTNNTVFIPAYNSDSKNYIRAGINNIAPYWAKKYKFVIKPSKGQYQTVYSNIYFVDDSGFAWFKLDGDNRSKVQENTNLIVKSDSSGVLNSLVRTKVLSLESKSEDFIIGNKNESGGDIIEPAGLYMKIRPSNFSVIYNENSFIDLGERSAQGVYGNTLWQGILSPILIIIPAEIPRDYPQLSYPFYIENPLFGEPGELEFKPYDLPAGSLINIEINLSRNGRNLDSNCGSRYYKFERSFVASQDYSDFHEFILGDKIDLTSGVTSGDDDTQNTNEFYASKIEYVGYIDTVPGMNQYQFQYESGTGKLFLVIASGTPNCGGVGKKYSRITCQVQVQRSGALTVFETESLDSNGETYFEGSESFDIVDGYHQGNVVNQSNGVPAVVDLNFFDCFAFGNGVESYKINDSLIGAPFYLGSRVTAVSQEDFKEAHRYAGITYSGIYNEETNVNKLNEFNLALANFKDCERSFGPINILYGRRTDVLTLQEDKISYVLAGKNLLSDAAGGGAITSIPEVLGTQISRIEEYGISSDAASFAVYGEDIYFTDSKRTSVINLKGGFSQSDALVPISRLGMSNWFRDEFKNKLNYQKIGGYDPYLREYVLSLNDTKLPSDLEIIDCGFTISQDNSSQEINYRIDFGDKIGEASFDYDFESGSANIVVRYDGVNVINTTINGSGTLSFEKTKVSPKYATISIIPTAATYVFVSNCVVSEEITVVRIVINSPSDEGKTIHNNYNWTLSGYTSPTNIDLVMLESDGVSLYDSDTAEASTGVIPAFGSTIKMQSEKLVTDTFNFDPLANSFKYLVSNTLYTESQINTLRPLLNTATPIVNPVTGKYESSFVYNNPSGNQYLYLVWDYVNAYSINLCYNEFSESEACTSCEDPEPVNCVVSEWSAWSECTEGTQIRTRTVIIPASNGGTPCPALTETRECGYKVISFVSNNSIQQTDCGGNTYYDFTQTVTVRLTEPDGVTPQINLTGANIVINMLVDYSGCFGDTNTYPSEVIIAPGQSETYIYNTGVTNNCGGVECTVVTDTYSCYTLITPSYIIPGQDFYPLCEEPDPVNCVVSEWSAWSVCEDGSQTRTRTIITPTSGGGTPCPVLSETRECTVQCLSYTISTSVTYQTTTFYTDCNGVEQQVTIGGSGSNESSTFCAEEGSVRPGVETSLALNGSCPEAVTPVDCVVSEWSAWSECTEGTSTRTRTVITPASDGGTACPVLTETIACTSTVRITYDVNFFGGDGSFNITSDDNPSYSTTVNSDGYVDVPYGSSISAIVYAPVADTSSGQTVTFYSRVFAEDSSGIIVDSGNPTSNSSSSIDFEITSNVTIKADASLTYSTGEGTGITGE